MAEDKKPENPSAFPWVWEDTGNPSEVCSGMTLRDYFAAKAMQAHWSTEGLTDVHIDRVAETSYKMADAMLKEREK